jgi:hypothetical protein
LVVIDGKKAAFPLSAGIAFARLDPAHKVHFSAVSERNLLMSTAYTEDRLFCGFDYLKDAREVFG